MAHAYRANLRVCARTVGIMTPTKRLRFRLQLHVRFDANRRFELRVCVDRKIERVVDRVRLLQRGEFLRFRRRCSGVGPPAPAVQVFRVSSRVLTQVC